MAGMAVVHRLLEAYPADHLVVAESDMFAATPAKRLPGVRYIEFRLGARRLSHSRLRPLVLEYWAALRRVHAERLVCALGGWRPEAVVTVTHTFSWWIAAHVARRLGVPLHLINHDDCLGTLAPTWKFDRLWRKRFGRTYGNAASRACVSPYMAELYEQDFGAAGDVVYPTWSRANPVFAAAAPDPTGPSPMFAYAGNIYADWYLDNLTRLAAALRGRGGEVHVFSNVPPPLARRLADSPNIRIRETLPSAALLETLRREAHALYLPLSFLRSMHREMIMSFPSKLVDYTAVGRPILMHGPRQCSSVRFALDHPGLAEVVTAEVGGDLEDAVARLTATGPGAEAHRLALGRAALAVGRQCFAPGVNYQRFVRLLGAAQER